MVLSAAFCLKRKFPLAKAEILSMGPKSDIFLNLSLDLARSIFE